MQSNESAMINLTSRLDRPRTLRSGIRSNLQAAWHRQKGYRADGADGCGNSAVVLLLGYAWNGRRFGDDVGIYFNKRSPEVRQPGDICCPGGGMELVKDRHLARILQLPGLPFGISRWVAANGSPADAGLERVALALATALREAWEEMRCNPLRFEFIGPLPAECLSLFQRRIYPLVGWSRGQKEFKPNWEVSAVPFIPLRKLLDPLNYVCLHLQYPPGMQNPDRPYREIFSGFRFDHDGQEEILWGATFRIVRHFLLLNFGFRAPPKETLPVRWRRMGAGYLGRPAMMA